MKNTMRRRTTHSSRRIALPTSIIIKTSLVLLQSQGPRLPKLRMKKTTYSIEGSSEEVAEYLINQSNAIVGSMIIRGPRTSFLRMMRSRLSRLLGVRSAFAMRDFRKP